MLKVITSSLLALGLSAAVDVTHRPALAKDPSCQGAQGSDTALFPITLPAPCCGSGASGCGEHAMQVDNLA